MKTILTAALALAGLASCAPEPDIVLYCALDEVHSSPLIRQFEAETGLTVLAEYDIEAHKTVGLVRRIREEAGHTRCDVFWNNEIAHTVSLANDGLLQPYTSPNASDIPDDFKDPGGLWTGLAARARVFIVNTELVAEEDTPMTMWDLFDPKWSGRCGAARPLTGTTLTHMTALYPVLGEEQAEAYVRRLAAGGRDGSVSLTGGNATLMKLVKTGELAWGWTDTDDYYVALDSGAPVKAVFPDAEGIGTLVIPNTVALIKNAPHAESAKRLIDFILSREVEERLAHSRSAQIPLHRSLAGMEHPLPLETLRPMRVDYAEVGALIKAKHDEFKELFLE